MKLLRKTFRTQDLARAWASNVQCAGYKYFVACFDGEYEVSWWVV